MLPFRPAYHDQYDLQFGPHVFPTIKYRLLRDRLVAEGHASPDQLLCPEPATRDDLLLAHTPEWVDCLLQGTLTPEQLQRLEIPYSPHVLHAFLLATGGTLLAARQALEHGVGVNLAGGFHHAFAGHGEGFCAVNDVAVAIRRLRQERAIGRAMVIDCDVHHGNGTAAVFAGDGRVFTLSLHQWNNYPAVKPPSTLDIHLPDGTGDEEYLHRLNASLCPSLEAFQPDLAVYLAGADPYLDDQLGGLALTMEGLRRRDELVLRACRGRNVPVAVTLAGGYARRVEDTVTIHRNTVLAAAAQAEADA